MATSNVSSSSFRRTPVAASAVAAAASLTSRPRVVHWYRTDLRVHDSPSLAAALALQPQVLWPVWCFDPAYVYGHRVGENRWRFLLDAMAELSASLTAINPAQRLLVLRGDPEAVFDHVFSQWEGVTHLVYEIDTSAYARSRDALIVALAERKGITVVPVLGHTLWSVPDVVKLNGGKPTMTFAQLSKAAAKLPPPARPLPVPAALPDPGPTTLLSATDGAEPCGFLGPDWVPPVDLNSAALGGYRATPPSCFAPDERTLTTVPSLASLSLPDGVEPSIPAGEAAALHRIGRLCADPAWVAGFAKPKSSPAASVDDFLEGTMFRSADQGPRGKGGGERGGGGSTFVLSPYLKFGCLSVRKFWHDALDATAAFKASQAATSKKVKVQTEPENLVGQLKFREMYICAEFAIPNFGRIRGNPTCRFIDWRCQTQYDEKGAEIVPRPQDDPEAEAHLEAWTHGRTGFPWIDALMRQLRTTGWIHHLGRHSVACFLTRGNLYSSWERGQEVFDELLLDWDPAANAGNWMWLSCSAFFSQYYRVYSPVAFPQKWDKTGQLVRKFCPELKDFPDKFIYSPWDAPLDVQRKAGCIIGKDYPSPIVDHKAAQSVTVEKIKSAYTANLHGADAAVLDGRAGQMLADAYVRIAPATQGKAGGKAGKAEQAGAKRAANPFELAKDNAAKRRKKEAE